MILRLSAEMDITFVNITKEMIEKEAMRTSTHWQQWDKNSPSSWQKSKVTEVHTGSSRNG